LIPPIPTQTTRTLSDWARAQTNGLTSAIGRWGVQYGISANAVTISGTLLTVIAAGLIASGALLLAGLLLIIVMPFDAIDGAIARASPQTSRFGALLDSTLDRYADSFLLLGLLFYFVSQVQIAASVIAGLALIGAYAVSYVRARAEGLGIACKEGVFTRFERTIVLIAALITGWVVPGIIILAVGSHVTALQRLIAVQRVIQAEEISES
jgi:CDP-diacylglycerol---glycerol-3-phosphate 3-phosphatidyltransferase